MTTRPYELLARFNQAGGVAGVSVRTITTVNGRDYEGDPEPLSGVNDPAFTQFASQFSASAVAERDQLASDKSALETLRDSLTGERDQLLTDKATLTAERDALFTDKQSLTEQLAATTSERDLLQAQVDPLHSRIAELEAELEAFLHPPANDRHLAPYVFLSRLQPQEIIALQTSMDPIVIVGRAKLQTIITYIDLDLPETQQLVQYMELQGLIQPGRAAEILA